MNWLLEVFLPLPIRWIWLFIFGLFCFYLCLLFIQKYADINGAEVLQELEEDDPNCHNFIPSLQSALLYSISCYSVLRLLLMIISESISPIIVVAFSILAFIQPFSLGSLSLRYRLLSSIKRVFGGSWRTSTTFCDLVLADVMTSYAKVLADWDALLWCYLLKPFIGSGPSCGSSFLAISFVWYPSTINFVLLLLF